MTSTQTHKPVPAPADLNQHARSIAEAVDAAWHSRFGGSRIEIPVGVVAAIALVAQADPDGPDLTQQALALSPPGTVAWLHAIWVRFAVARPDLLPRTKPLWSWLDEADDLDSLDDQLVRAVHATARAALRKGQIALTGHTERRHAVDLLGTVLQSVRSRSSIKGRGQYLTPPDVANLMGRVLSLRPGQSVMEPCAGTGTMFLGLAQTLRENGHDPASCEWWANDIDWLAAACCAINLHCWGLGRRVVIGCGDGLTDTWMHTALQQRQAAIDEVDRLWQMAGPMAAVRHLLGLPPPQDPLSRHLEAAATRTRPAPPPPPSSTFDPDAVYQQGTLF